MEGYGHVLGGWGLGSGVGSGLGYGVRGSRGTRDMKAYRVRVGSWNIRAL